MIWVFRFIVVMALASLVVYLLKGATTTHLRDIDVKKEEARKHHE